MKISRLAAVLVIAGLLSCVCVSATSISKPDLIDCLLGNPVDVICPEE